MCNGVKSRGAGAPLQNLPACALFAKSYDRFMTNGFVVASRDRPSNMSSTSD